jgi:glucitol/sorbitol PTS system EIIC component
MKGVKDCMEWLQWFGEHFIGMFQEGGKTFVGMIKGIVPTLVVLLTFTYAMIKFIGEERVNKAILFASKYMLLRYTVMPILAVLILTNPMCYTFGRFLPEKQKPAFYDSAVSFVHPVTALFPYANAGELFVYLGIANGLKEAGYSISELAIRYFLVGIVVILLRGIITEYITKFLAKRMEANQRERQFINVHKNESEYI